MSAYIGCSKNLKDLKAFLLTCSFYIHAPNLVPVRVGERRAREVQLRTPPLPISRAPPFRTSFACVGDEMSSDNLGQALRGHSKTQKTDTTLRSFSIPEYRFGHVQHGGVVHLYQCTTRGCCTPLPMLGRLNGSIPPPLEKRWAKERSGLSSRRWPLSRGCNADTGNRKRR